MSIPTRLDDTRLAGLWSEESGTTIGAVDQGGLGAIALLLPAPQGAIGDLAATRYRARPQLPHAVARAGHPLRPEPAHWSRTSHDRVLHPRARALRHPAAPRDPTIGSGLGGSRARNEA